MMRLLDLGPSSINIQTLILCVSHQLLTFLVKTLATALWARRAVSAFNSHLLRSTACPKSKELARSDLHVTLQSPIRNVW